MMGRKRGTKKNQEQHLTIPLYLNYDMEAGVWIALSSDDAPIGIALENTSLKVLLERVLLLAEDVGMDFSFKFPFKLTFL